MLEKQLNKYISSVKWRRARDGSHEYTVIDWAPALRDDFKDFIIMVYAKGYKKNFYGTEYTYFDFEGYTYWGMNYPINETTLINRRKTDLSGEEF